MLQQFAIHHGRLRPSSTPSQFRPDKAIILGHEIGTVHRFERYSRIRIPFALEKVAAGFPSPAQDYVERRLDLNEHLIDNPLTTFIVAVASLSMKDAGIDVDDELIVDRSKHPRHGDVVVAVIDNEFTVKRLIQEEGRCWLKAENPDYPDIHLRDGQELLIWGVVTCVLKRLKK